MCVDTDSGAKCECLEGFFGDSNGANGQECFNNGVFEEMINDIKQIYFKNNLLSFVYFVYVCECFVPKMVCKIYVELSRLLDGFS